MRANKGFAYAVASILFLIWVGIILQLIYTRAEESMLVEILRFTVFGFSDFSVDWLKYLAYAFCGKFIQIITLFY